ncbi:hypothetical protein QTP70_024589 [Hemibagrus guttatus]|uniref:Alkylated DNA repair protein AlkB homologue 8 N-terminal domain-containing protein n=1 Tax=Hemibagrus guttatus TaxID=175788 RepID=A0AAE0USG6_9TELE|nr:hypothetical protein QTP70_024589 [Hemibagrus guttatus]
MKEMVVDFRLRKAHLPPPILTTFYKGTIESILSRCITAWFGNCTVLECKTLQRIPDSFIVFRLSGARSRGQQSKQGCPDLPLPRHFLQLFRRDPEVFPGQPRDIVSPVCPGSSPGPLPGGAYPEHLPRETSRRHLKQMPEPPQLPPFDVEEQQLYTKLLPGDRDPYPISKGAPCLI